MNHYKNFKQNKSYKRPSYKRRQHQQRQSIQDDKFINFCNKKSIVLDDNIKNQVFQQLTKKYLFQLKKIVKDNNIPHPEFLVTINNKNKYNFLLFLTNINGKNYNIFVYNNNGKIHLFSVKFGFSQELYRGTLFQGELTQNEKKCWFFFITDLIFYMGNYYQLNKLSDKILLIGEILKEKYEYDEFINTCHLKLKSYFLFNHLQFIKNNCQLLFVSEYFEDYTYLIDIKIKKEKKEIIEDDIVKEFIIRKTEKLDVYELYDIKTNMFNSIACVNKLKTSMRLREEFRNKESFKIKTRYSQYFNSWIPIF